MPFEPELTCRIALVLIILSTAAIGVPFRIRADRAGGHVPTRVDPRWFWIIMGIIGPPLVVACVGFIVAPRALDFAVWPPLGRVRWLGIPVGAVGVLLFGWIFRHLGLNVTSTSMPRAAATLVTSGPYRWIRHPMYSAALLLVVATALMTANVIAAIGGLAMFALLAARSRIEEKRLIEKFGNSYRDYQRRTGRFFPGV